MLPYDVVMRPHYVSCFTISQPLIHRGGPNNVREHDGRRHLAGKGVVSERPEAHFCRSRRFFFRFKLLDQLLNGVFDGRSRPRSAFSQGGHQRSSQPAFVQQNGYFVAVNPKYLRYLYYAFSLVGDQSHLLSMPKMLPWFTLVS